MHRHVSFTLRAAGVLLACAFALSAARADSLTMAYTAISVPGAAATAAVGVNDGGVVSGSYVDGTTGNEYGFVRDSSGNYTTLSVPGGLETVAFGISNNGQVVGVYETGSGDTGGFIYSADSYTTFVPPTQDESFTPWTINNSGQIAGDSYTGTIGNFSALCGCSEAFGVNDSGTYVGVDNDNSAALILNPDGSQTEFSVPGTDFTEADSINDSGVIAGDYDGPDGNEDLFFYNPTTQQFTFINGPTGDDAIYAVNDNLQVIAQDDQGNSYLGSPVPEPAPWLLLGTGLLGLGFATRRRRLLS